MDFTKLKVELDKDILNLVFSEHDIWIILSTICDKFKLKLMLATLDSSVLFSHPFDMEAKDVLPNILDDDVNFNQSISTIFKKHKLFIDDPDNMGSRRIHAPIIINSSPYGFLSVVADIEDMNFHCYATKSLTRLCERLISANVYSSLHDTVIDSYISRTLLIDGGDRAENVRDESLVRLQSKTPPSYAIAALSGNVSTAQILRDAASAVPMYLSKAHYLISEDVLYIFFYDLRGKSFADNDLLLHALKEFCNRFSLSCGLSSLFHNLNERWDYRRQALLTLDLCRGKQNILFAEEQYCNIVFMSAIKGAEKELFSLSEIEILNRYDKENDTDYSRTLYVYLMNHNRVKAAATELFIDHSTLIYRLGKIKTIIGRDINDTTLALQLKTAIALYQFTSDFDI